MAKKKERNTRTIKCRGYKPDAHQRAVHLLLNQKGKGHIVVVKSKRQVGKSLMIENELLRYACTWSGTTSICVSPTLTQARKIFKEIDAALSNSGIVKNSNATLLEMSFINGSRIFFKSAEQKENLRGYTVSGILCIDEAAYISDDVFYTVLPWTDVKHANILICSTPRTRQGFFYDYFQRGLDEAENGIFAVDWNSFDLTRFLSNERLEQYRKIIPSNQFKSEYLGEWLDADGSVFINFKECVKKNTIKEMISCL